MECSIYGYRPLFEQNGGRPPETKERIPVKYTEADTIEGFEIEQVDEQTEKIVLSKFGGVIR